MYGHLNHFPVFWTCSIIYFAFRVFHRRLEFYWHHHVCSIHRIFRYKTQYIITFRNGAGHWRSYSWFYWSEVFSDNNYHFFLPENTIFLKTVWKFWLFGRNDVSIITKTSSIHNFLLTLDCILFNVLQDFRCRTRGWIERCL